eukprot:12333263-Karenia_brevis.AAC.1
MASDIDPLIGTPFEGHDLDSGGDLDIDFDLCSDTLVEENVIPIDESYSFNMVAEPDRESQASQKSGVPMNKEF